MVLLTLIWPPALFVMMSHMIKQRRSEQINPHSSISIFIAISKRKMILIGINLPFLKKSMSRAREVKRRTN
ncbi:hypothetical protein BY996DRAFT_6833267 [Phakopsora pachyrhizi]|nr:hypothetical protein BY996DRAFT_6833267 [Phakopsora pachyrhizi]